EADNTGTGVEDSIAVRKGKVMLQGQLEKVGLFNLELEQLDAKTAFLYGNLKE
nr:hypothetical protein [Tanacetum cinerariifolium]